MQHFGALHVSKGNRVEDTPDYRSISKEQMKVEQSLDRHFPRTKTFFMILHPEDLTITYISQQGPAMLGDFSEKELMGKHLLDVIGQKYEQCAASLKALPKTGETLQMKHTPIKVGKETHYFNICYKVSDQNDLEGILCKWEDDTARLKVEEQLEIARYELEYMIYKASHDLRAPLLSVLGLVGISEATGNGAEFECLPLIKTSILKLDKFISDMVSFSENQKMMVRTEKIDFETMIEAMLQNMDRFLPNMNQVAIRTEYAGNEEFFSDPIRLNLIISNLLSNSFQFFDPRKDQPEIKVTIEKHQDYACIKVHDNGRGIEQEVIDRIFDMFFRGSEYSKGSGLGLYMVKEAVNRLKGEINVSSQPDQGTYFTITLPNHRVVA